MCVCVFEKEREREREIAVGGVQVEEYKDAAGNTCITVDYSMPIDHPKLSRLLSFG